MPRTGERLLGLDYGRRRVGVATCDPLGIAVEPYGFVKRASDVQLAQAVSAIAAREGCAGIVVGLPLHASGVAGNNVRYVRRFLRVLREHCPLPVYEVDERHSSSEAEMLLRREGAWPAPPGALDARAAAVILRRWLDGE